MVTHPPEARLLVVDDEPNILELLSASLRYAGFEVTTASTGTEAVAAAHKVCPYSNAVRGNIEVSLTANGAPVGG